MKKTRSCVISEPKEMNKDLQTIVLAPKTRSSKTYPKRVEVKHNKTKGWIVLDQIRTIDRQRIVKLLGALVDKEISNLKAILKETYVD